MKAVHFEPGLITKIVKVPRSGGLYSPRSLTMNYGSPWHRHREPAVSHVEYFPRHVHINYMPVPTTHQQKHLDYAFV